VGSIPTFGIYLGRGAGKPELERRSGAPRALDANLSSVAFDDRLDDRQAEAGPAIPERSARVPAIASLRARADAIRTAELARLERHLFDLG
jgi:hypothetical protein